MSRLARSVLERLTALDLNLMSRFPRRELSRLATALSTRQQVGTSGTASAEDVLGDRVLRGLEVSWKAGDGWSLRLSYGSLIARLASPATETRPGSWSGRLEPDDFAFAVGVLPPSPGASVSDTTVTLTPSSPPAGALVGQEVWYVVAKVTEETIETTSAIKLWNKLTGVYDNASGPKVRQHKITARIIRGAAGVAFSASLLDADDTLLAIVVVPNGATTHALSTIFDCRRLPEGGPNRVGGAWSTGFDGGELPAPYTADVLRGYLWGRLKGETLSAYVRKDLQLGDICEPGATWDDTASLASPKFAWLYLAKPGGVVPRPVRRGESALGQNGTLDAETLVMAGVLVLSPTTPRVGVRASDFRSPTGGRWDLRPSSPLRLPSIARGDIAYPFLNTVTSEAICVGFLRYTGLNGSGLPLVRGWQSVDEQGWMRGASIASDSSGSSNADATASAGLLTGGGAFTLGNVADPRTATSAATNVGTIVRGGVTYPLPLTEVELQVSATLSGAGLVTVRGREGFLRLASLSIGSVNFVEGPIRRHIPLPGSTLLDQVLLNLPASTTFVTANAFVHAVRFPYGDELAG